MNIYDIAVKSGVSIATVSRVLNNSPKVRTQTRERILAVMEEEGYVPNAFARGLGLDTMQMVGVMCTDVTDIFYANAVGFVEKQLCAQGMDVVLCCTGNDLKAKKEKLSYLVNRKVDAVILIGSAFKEEKDNSHIKAATEHLPIIIINGYIDLPNVYCVVCDERSAMRQNVTALYNSGCRKILYLYDANTYSGMEKLAGYREGVEACGIALEEGLIVRTGKSVGASEQAVMQLIESGSIPDSIMASEDMLAAGALNALHKKGMRRPVIGFNNSIIAECTRPLLTSVDNMLEAQCDTAVHTLKNLGEKKFVPSKTVISSKLVERESFRLMK